MGGYCFWEETKGRELRLCKSAKADVLCCSFPVFLWLREVNKLSLLTSFAMLHWWHGQRGFFFSVFGKTSVWHPFSWVLFCNVPSALFVWEGLLKKVIGYHSWPFLGCCIGSTYKNGFTFCIWENLSWYLVLSCHECFACVRGIAKEANQKVSHIIILVFPHCWIITWCLKVCFCVPYFYCTSVYQVLVHKKRKKQATCLVVLDLSGISWDQPDCGMADIVARVTFPCHLHYAYGEETSFQYLIVTTVVAPVIMHPLFFSWFVPQHYNLVTKTCCLALKSRVINLVGRGILRHLYVPRCPVGN